MAEDFEVTLDKIVSLCKRRGFVFPTAEIYSGLNGVYDFGPLGFNLKRNIEKVWIESLQKVDEDIVFIDGAILGPEAVWKASGHVENFSDPMVDCLNCKRRFRADEVDLNKPCPVCGVKKWTDVRQFNLMFKTEVGALSDQTNIAYLRPETAQSIFINFKNVMTSSRCKIPFGIAQIGKAYRNEITPKQFLFRAREFEQMELEFFCKEADARKFFDSWLERREKFYFELGINPENLRIRKHEQHELAHYSKYCSDIEYRFPFGWKELEGIAYRTDYDLKQHIEYSGKDLSVYDQEEKRSYIPHVIECSVGIGRMFLTLLLDAYHEDFIEGERRIVLRLHPKVAPVIAAVLPLSKKLSENAEKIYCDLKMKGFIVQFDDSGSIGKRYRRQDEIGTPVCVTFDFDSLEDQKVTVRNRDTLEQERISIDQLDNYLGILLKK